MPDEETPGPLRAYRPNGEHGGSVDPLLYEMCRQTRDLVRELRQAIGAMQGQLSDGSRQMAVHEHQLAELIDNHAQQEDRLRRLEDERIENGRAAIAELQRKENERASRETEAEKRRQPSAMTQALIIAVVTLAANAGWGVLERIVAPALHQTTAPMKGTP